MMFQFKSIKTKIITSSAILLSAVTLNAHAATATYDPASGLVDMPVVEVLSGGTSAFYHAKLQVVGNALQLVSAEPIAAATGQRNVYDGDTNSVHVQSVTVGADDFYVKLKYVPGSNPMTFNIDQLANNAFTTCPSFAQPGVTPGSCMLSGTVTSDIKLTKNIEWILDKAVFIGGKDNTNPATLTINPGTKIVGVGGQGDQAAYLWIRPGSKIMAEGTPDNPIIMTGPNEAAAGEWGGFLISGNAPVNGCNDGVPVCKIPFEAFNDEVFGGNNPTDNSGVMKYVQIRFAGTAVRPDEELNGFTLNGVGSGTLIDYVQVHEGLDDGIEVFGGTVQMKHLVITNAQDDSLDWTQGWKGKAQFVLIKQHPDVGDRGIEADNNEKNNDSTPRSQPILSNLTILGRGGESATQSVLLRRGTGANIWNSVFVGSPVCLMIDSPATFLNAGNPGSLTGSLTIQNSYVNCAANYKDGKDATFTTENWFTSQSENVAGDPLLSGYLPTAGSPLTLGGAAVSDPFFNAVDYVGAFKDQNNDWTKEWTAPNSL